MAAVIDKDPTVLLKEDWDFPEWYAILQSIARINDTWRLIDPDAPDAPNAGFNLLGSGGEDKSQSQQTQSIMDYDQYIQHLQKLNQNANSLEKAAWEARRAEAPAGTFTEPEPKEKTFEPSESQFRYQSYLAREQLGRPSQALTAGNLQKTWTWIMKTVAKDLLHPSLMRLATQNVNTVQQVVRNLREALGINDATVQSMTGKLYANKLTEATKSGTSMEKWYKEWIALHERAVVYRCREVEGPQAIEDFLRAVGSRFDPEWARNALKKHWERQRVGKEVKTLEHHGKTFGAIVKHREIDKRTHTQGIFATATYNGSGANESSTQPRANQNPRGPRNQQNGQSKEIHCPCSEPTSSWHRWAPEKCYTVKYALTGETPDNGKWRAPGSRRVSEILERLGQNRYKALRRTLKNEGIMPENWPAKGAEGSNSQNTSSSKSGRHPASGGITS